MRRRRRSGSTQSNGSSDLRGDATTAWDSTRRPPSAAPDSRGSPTDSPRSAARSTFAARRARARSCRHDPGGPEGDERTTESRLGRSGGSRSRCAVGAVIVESSRRRRSRERGCSSSCIRLPPRVLDRRRADRARQPGNAIGWVFVWDRARLGGARRADAYAAYALSTDWRRLLAGTGRRWVGHLVLRPAMFLPVASCSSCSRTAGRPRRGGGRSCGSRSSGTSACCSGTRSTRTTDGRGRPVPDVEPVRRRGACAVLAIVVDHGSSPDRSWPSARCPVVTVIRRPARRSGDERQQITWLAYAGVFVLGDRRARRRLDPGGGIDSTGEPVGQGWSSSPRLRAPPDRRAASRSCSTASTTSTS